MPVFEISYEDDDGNIETERASFPDELDALTQDRIKSKITVRTELDDGEQRSYVDQTWEEMEELARTMLDGVIENSRLSRGVSAGDLTSESQQKLLEHYNEKMKAMGMRVKKKGQ